MSVLVQFDKGAIGTPHAHDAHEPIAFVIADRFESDIGGEKRARRPSDAFVAPRPTLHGVVALDDSATLRDQLSPRRDDDLSSRATSAGARTAASPGPKSMGALNAPGLNRLRARREPPAHRAQVALHQETTPARVPSVPPSA
ncbi:hypothetical protein [Roseateles sp.]|uniref:hypothetical protein n=1 Tax=Roseateles sp. TaxID=1971397 RepID=UPI0025E1C8D4|nr:hypothetical protein [Roseateles sp.]MBV8036409.1 hypothetical protein [Roseateles sp.]